MYTVYITQETLFTVLVYLDPPVPRIAIIDSHSAICQGVTKPTTVHVTQCCYSLHTKEEQCEIIGLLSSLTLGKTIKYCAT